MVFVHGSGSSRFSRRNRFVADVFAVAMDAFRGRPYQTALARAEAFAVGSDEIVVVGQLHSTKALVALAEGRFPDAFTHASAAEATTPGFATVQGPAAFRAALWAGDAAGAHEAAERFRAKGSHGRAINAQLRGIDAGLLAIEGRSDEATAAYRDAIRQWRDLSCWFDLAMCELDFVRFVGGESPDIEAAASEAREIFTRLGAPTLLQRLDEAVGLPKV